MIQGTEVHRQDLASFEELSEDSPADARLFAMCQEIYRYG